MSHSICVRCCLVPNSLVVVFANLPALPPSILSGTICTHTFSTWCQSMSYSGRWMDQLNANDNVAHWKRRLNLINRKDRNKEGIPLPCNVADSLSHLSLLKTVIKSCAGDAQAGLPWGVCAVPSYDILPLSSFSHDPSKFCSTLLQKKRPRKKQWRTKASSTILMVQTLQWNTFICLVSSKGEKYLVCTCMKNKKSYLSAGQIKCCNIFSGHLTGGLRRRFSSPAGPRSPDSAELICSHLGPLSSLSELIRAELSLSARSGAPPPSTGARCRGPPPAESLKEHLLWSSVTYKCVVGPTGCRGNKKVKECLKKKRERKEHSKCGGIDRAVFFFIVLANELQDWRLLCSAFTH